MGTKRDKPLHTSPRPLTPEQLNAVDLLATGATDAVVATAVGVHRVTVTKWRTSPTFLAALNRRRADLFASATDTLRDLIPKALAVIGEALADADPDRRTAAAFDLLKVAKLPAGALIGPTDPRELVDEEVCRRTAIEGTRRDQLIASMDGEPTYAERFAATWNDLETAAVEPPVSPPELLREGKIPEVGRLPGMGVEKSGGSEAQTVG